MKINRDILKVLIIILFFVVVFMMDDSLCIFKRYTGIPCPGCGMTRSYLSLVRLDFKNAFYYHPLFVLPAIVGFLWIFKVNFLQKSKKINLFWGIMALMFIATWIIRMIVFFPNTPPMDYNSHALIPYIINFIKSWI